MEARAPIISKQPSKNQLHKKVDNSRLRLVSERHDERSGATEQLYDIAVIGLGYVGLPLCIAFAKANATVLGVDIDSSKSARIGAGKSYIKHIPNEDIQQSLRKSGLKQQMISRN